MRTLNINAKKQILLMNRGFKNFQKCGFCLISEKCVRTGFSQCGQIRLNADECANFIACNTIVTFNKLSQKHKTWSTW